MAHRDRLFIVLGVVGCALVIIQRQSLLPLAVIAVALALLVINAFVAAVRLVETRRGQAGFDVFGGGFSAGHAFPHGVIVMVWLILLGMNAGMMLRSFGDPEPAIRILAWAQLAGLTPLTSAIIAFAVVAWDVTASAVRLTPEGVVTRTLGDTRRIPWEALAPGGPLPPGPRDTRIQLAFARPELVRRRRFRLPGKADRITTQLDVAPWLVAYAIRWYVEHPEDRAAIGTQAEHDRLIATVGAVPHLPTPQQPPAVRAAIRLGYLGVAFGLLTAALDVALVFGFSERLKAYAVEVGEREVRDLGMEPADWASGVAFTQSWYVGAAVLVGIAAAVGLLSIRALGQGNPVGRGGLIAVSALAMAWALVPCFDVAFEPPPDLATLFVAVTVIKRLGYLALAAPTLILLLTPSTHVFTQARHA